jgi:bifunctional ADP-heptose synthase (sugar kinase/adenylyltransferase)
VNPLEDRLAVVAALESVTLVTWFEEDTPIARILECRPDHLVKGGDWTPERIVGAAEVQAWGGQVHSIAFRHERSTTQLLSRIRK